MRKLMVGLVVTAMTMVSACAMPCTNCVSWFNTWIDMNWNPTPQCTGGCISMVLGTNAAYYCVDPCVYDTNQQVWHCEWVEVPFSPGTIVNTNGDGTFSSSATTFCYDALNTNCGCGPYKIGTVDVQMCNSNYPVIIDLILPNCATHVCWQVAITNDSGICRPYILYGMAAGPVGCCGGEEETKNSPRTRDSLLASRRVSNPDLWVNRRGAYSR